MSSEYEQGRGRHRWALATAALLTAVGAGLLTAGALAQDPPPPDAPVDRAERRSTGQVSPPAREGAEYVLPTGPILGQSRPESVRIPALDVSAPLVTLGLQDNGEMEVPGRPGVAGWYRRGPSPGELGPAVIAGHVTWNGEPDVFFELGSLRRGQQVEVARRNGRTAVFEVTQVRQYPKRRFPTSRVYGSVDHAALRLITCGGYFDGDNYRDNVVVYARLVGSAAT